MLSGSLLQLLRLWARGVSWWKTKSLSYADLQCFICYSARNRIPTKRTCREPDRMAMPAFKRTGGISPPWAVPHSWPRRVFINLRPRDLWEVAKRKLKRKTRSVSNSLSVKGHNAALKAVSSSKVGEAKALMSSNDELRSKRLSSLQIRRRRVHGNKLPRVSIITSKNCMQWQSSRCWSKLGFQCGMTQTLAQYSLFSLTLICSGWE